MAFAGPLTTKLKAVFIVVTLLPCCFFAERGQYSQDVYGVASGITYVVPLVLGQPVYNPSNPGASSKNTFNLLLDTGSANEAVISQTCCENYKANVFNCAGSSTCAATSTNVRVSYVAGNWNGNLVQDTLSSANLSSHTNIPFVSIQKERNFIQEGYQGIMGLAYDSIAQPFDSPPPTFFQSLVNKGETSNKFSLLLCGTLQTLLDANSVSTTQSLHSGQWVLGGEEGPNGEVYHKDVVMYSPIAEERWYVVVIGDMELGGQSLGLPCSDYNSPNAIVDSGTSNLAVPSVVYKQLVAQLESAITTLIPEFNLRYFNDEIPCCETYCNASDASSILLKLPDITLTLAFEDGGNTDKYFKVSIPPQYYFRPVVSNSANQRRECRTFGISESSSTVLGDVFMDGLYTVHNRDGAKIGFGVADNCPNRVTSKKIVTQTAFSNGKDWCECLSEIQRESSRLSSYFPGTSPCFFWFWWMYLIIAAFIVIIACVAYMTYVFFKINNRKKLVEETNNVRMYTNNTAAIVDNSTTPSTNYELMGSIEMQTPNKSELSLKGNGNGNGNGTALSAGMNANGALVKNVSPSAAAMTEEQQLNLLSSQLLSSTVSMDTTVSSRSSRSTLPLLSSTESFSPKHKQAAAISRASSIEFTRNNTAIPPPPPPPQTKEEPPFNTQPNSSLNSNINESHTIMMSNDQPQHIGEINTNATPSYGFNGYSASNESSEIQVLAMHTQGQNLDYERNAQPIAVSNLEQENVGRVSRYNDVVIDNIPKSPSSVSSGDSHARRYSGVIMESSQTHIPMLQSHGASELAQFSAQNGTNTAQVESAQNPNANAQRERNIFIDPSIEYLL